MSRFFEDKPTSVIPSTTQSDLKLFVDRVLQSLPSAQVAQNDLELIRAQLQKDCLRALEDAHNNISLIVVRQNLMCGKYDNEIFVEPKRTPELELLIKNDPSSFMQHLFVFCQKKDTLDFWLTEGGVVMPKDGLAQAIRLHANMFVFEKLNAMGYFENISPLEKETLLKQSTVYLKMNPESLAYLQEALSRVNNILHL